MCSAANLRVRFGIVITALLGSILSVLEDTLSIMGCVRSNVNQSD